MHQLRNFFSVSPKAANVAAQLIGFSGKPHGTNFMELTDLSTYLTVLQGAYWHLRETRSDIDVAQIDVLPEAFFLKNLRLPKGFFSHSLHANVQQYGIGMPLDNGRFSDNFVYPGENEVHYFVDRIRILGHLHDASVADDGRYIICFRM